MYGIVALWPPALQCQLPALFFVCALFVLFLLSVVVLSGEPKQNQGRGLVDRKLVQSPSNFIASRPKAALLYWFFGDLRCGVLFWFFGDLRCGMLLFMVILVIFQYKNR